MAIEEVGLDVQIRAELDRFDAAMAAAGQDVIKFGSDADRGTKRAYDGFRRLEASLDPSARALQRLEQRMAIVDRGVTTGRVSLEREIEVRARANTAYETTIAKINGVSQSVEASTVTYTNLAGSITLSTQAMAEFTAQAAEARAAQAAAANQSQFNATMGVRDFNPGAAKASAQVFEDVARAEARAKTELDQLSAASQRYRDKINPLLAVHRQYANGLAEVNQLNRAGELTDRQRAQAVDLLTREFEQSKIALNGLEGAQNRMRTSAYRGGQQIQNFGYQIGDFAVQVASGQGVLRPFIQQSNQLISGFGPWGAVIGAAVAVVGALVTSFVDLGGESEGAGEKAANALDQAKAEVIALNKELRDTATYFERMALDQEKLRQGVAESGVAAAKVHLDNLSPGDDPVAAQRAFLRAQDDVSKAYIAEDAALKGIETRRDNVIVQIAAETKRNIELVATVKSTGYSYEVVTKAMEIMDHKGFRGTQESALRAAAAYVESQKALDGLKTTTDKHTKSVAEQKKAFDDYISTVDLKTQQIQNEIDGQAELNPLLEAEAALTRSMGRELLPDEIDKLKSKIELQTKTTAALERQKQVQKDADKQVAESAKVWQHWRDNVQDAFADTLLSGENFASKLTTILKRAAAEAVAAWAMGGQASANGFLGAFQSAMGGGSMGGGMSSPSALSNVGSMFGGQNGLLSTVQSGANWASNGLGFGNLFGGGATATAAAQSVGTVGAHAAPRTLPAASATSAAGSTGGLTAGLSAIPVWGWIMAAAALVKGQVEGSDPKTWQGAASTLLMPSMEEWQANPARSLYNVVNPLGTVAADFGMPQWLSGGLNGVDPFGGFITGLGAPNWLTPGGIFEGLFGGSGPSNMVAGLGVDVTKATSTAVSYDPKEYSAQNAAGVQALADQFLAIQKALLEASGGKAGGYVALGVGSRDGIKAGYSPLSYSAAGASGKIFANSQAGAVEALASIVKALASNVTGATNPAILNAIKNSSATDLTANVNTVAQYAAALKQISDDASPAAVALRAVGEAFDPLIDSSRKLGLDVSKLTAERDKEIKSIRDQVQSSVDFAMTGDALAGQIKAVNDNFEALKDNATALGIATTGLAAAQAKAVQRVRDEAAYQSTSFTSGLDIRAATLGGNDRLALELQLQAEKQNQLHSAQSLVDQSIITTTQFQRLGNILDQEIAKSLEAFDVGLTTATTTLSAADAAGLAFNPVKAISGFIAGLNTSDLSPLNTQQKAALAQTEFDRIIGQAQAGDLTAIGQFGDAANTLLQLTRQVDGSGTGYLDIYNRIVAAADSIGTIDPDQLIAKTIEMASQTQTQTLVEALAEIRDEVAALRASNALLINKPSQAA